MSLISFPQEEWPEAGPEDAPAKPQSARNSAQTWQVEVNNRYNIYIDTRGLNIHGWKVVKYRGFKPSEDILWVSIILFLPT